VGERSRASRQGTAVLHVGGSVLIPSSIAADLDASDLDEQERSDLARLFMAFRAVDLTALLIGKRGQCELATSRDHRGPAPARDLPVSRLSHSAYPDSP
jgi:hypothetical protein